MEYNLSGKEYVIINELLIKNETKEKALDSISKISEEKLSQIKSRTFQNKKTTTSILNFLDNYVKLRDCGLLLPLGTTQTQIQVTTPMQIQPSSNVIADPNWQIPCGDEYYVRPPADWKPLTEQERWAIGQEWVANGRQKMTAEQAEKRQHKRWEYPFFINPYKKIDTYNIKADLDVKLLIYLIERNAVGRVEFETLLNQNDGESKDILVSRTENFDYYDLIPSHYTEFQNMDFWRTLQAAEERVCPNYLVAFDNHMERLKDDYIFFKSYYIYLTMGIGDPIIHPKNYDELMQLQERVDGSDIYEVIFKDNKMTVILKEEDIYGNEKYEYTFDTELDMMENIVWALGCKPCRYQFVKSPQDNLDYYTFDVFGKTYTLLDVLRNVYKANPKGSPHIPYQTFFRGYKEAIDAGFIEFRGGMWTKSFDCPYDGKFLVAPRTSFYYVP